MMSTMKRDRLKEIAEVLSTGDDYRSKSEDVEDFLRIAAELHVFNVIERQLRLVRDLSDIPRDIPKVLDVFVRLATRRKDLGPWYDALHTAWRKAEREAYEQV